MKTLFTMGFQNSLFWAPQRPYLGQPQSGTLTADDKNAVYTDIDNSINAFRTLIPIINRSDFATFMGPDLAGFNTAYASAQKLEPEMEAVMNRISSGNAEDQYWTDQERADLLTWKAAIAKMTSLITAARQRPSAAPPKAPEPTILGVPQGPALVAGGVLAVAAGIFFFA